MRKGLGRDACLILHPALGSLHISAWILEQNPCLPPYFESRKIYVYSKIGIGGSTCRITAYVCTTQQYYGHANVFRSGQGSLSKRTDE